MVKYHAMFPRKIKVCDAFGIPVYLDFSLAILLILFVNTFGSFIYGLSFAMVECVSVLTSSRSPSQA